MVGDEHERRGIGARVLSAVRSAWIPLAIMPLVVILDIWLGPETYLAPLLLVCPALAAASARPLTVLVVGALALAIRVPLGLYDDVFEDALLLRTSYFVNAALIVITIVSASMAAARERRERTLTAVTSVARAAQQALLFPLPARVGDLHIGLRYFSAAAEAQIGGDLYEVMKTPYGIRVLIGDVCGRGLTAVRTAAVVLGAFREAAGTEPDPVVVSDRVERSLMRAQKRRQLAIGDYVTALFVTIAAPGSATLVHRGHELPLVHHADGRLREIRPPRPAPPLGFGHLGAAPPAAYTFGFGPGDRLLLYTDGVTDTRNADQVFYPLRERLPALPNGSVDATVSALHADVLRHAGRPIPDDALIMLIERGTLSL